MTKTLEFISLKLKYLTTELCFVGSVIQNLESVYEGEH